MIDWRYRRRVLTLKTTTTPWMKDVQGVDVDLARVAADLASYHQKVDLAPNEFWQSLLSESLSWASVIPPLRNSICPLIVDLRTPVQRQKRRSHSAANLCSQFGGGEARSTSVGPHFVPHLAAIVI